MLRQVTAAAVLVLVLVFGLAVPQVYAQAAAPPKERTEIGGQVAFVRQSEFDATDVGVGGRLAFDLTDLVAIEGQFTIFPRHLGSPVAFSGHRLEGLVGLTVGTRGPSRVFGMVEPGFVRFGPSPDVLVCVLIFPAPLTCTLAGGQTEFALALGGGATMRLNGRVNGRVDVSDLLIHFVRGGKAVTSFTSHNLRIAAGLGFRF